MINKTRLNVVLSILIFTLAGCGLKGPLYETEPETEKTVEQTKNNEQQNNN